MEMNRQEAAARAGGGAPLQGGGPSGPATGGPQVRGSPRCPPTLPAQTTGSAGFCDSAFGRLWAGQGSFMQASRPKRALRAEP